MTTIRRIEHCAGMWPDTCKQSLKPRVRVRGFQPSLQNTGVAEPGARRDCAGDLLLLRRGRRERGGGVVSLLSLPLPSCGDDVLLRREHEKNEAGVAQRFGAQDVVKERLPCLAELRRVSDRRVDDEDHGCEW